MQPVYLTPANAGAPAVADVLLLQLGGVAAGGAAWLAMQGLAELGLQADQLQAPAMRRLLEQELRIRGFVRGTLAWPSLANQRALQQALGRAGVSIHWLGSEAYPAKLMRLPEAERPAWVLAAGAPRWQRPACAVIGSRAAGTRWLNLARKLGRALAEGGVVVVSGLATGCDSAAHAGAVLAGGRGAGTLAIPACGLLLAQPAPVRIVADDHTGLAAQLRQFSWLGIARPGEGFNAGLAIRRNDVIAACAEALVLVASDLKGGSSYAVRWALRHGVPLFCFEDGTRTPPANAQLLRTGQARALPAGDPPAQWLALIREGIATRPAAGAKPTQSCAQPVLFASG